MLPLKHHTPLPEETFSKKEAISLGIIGNESLGFVHPTQAFKKVNKQIMEHLKAGDLFWRKPWRDGYRVKGITYGPQNFVTGNPYRGMNAWYINFVNFNLKQNNSFFLTAKQVHDRGGKLKKDAVPYPVHAFIKGTKIEKNKEGKEEQYHYAGWVNYVVYPIDHTEGVKPIKRKNRKVTPEEIIVDAETLIDKMPKRPEIKHGGNEAYYTRALDYVQMPFKKAFKKPQAYYSTLFHELIHSTGHPKRVGREREASRKFGDKKYAFEELIAELGAAYLCAVCDIEYHTLKNSAAYLKGWAKKVMDEVKEDHSFMFRAILGASKAAKYIIGNSLEKVGLKRAANTQMKMDLSGIKDPALVMIYRYSKLHNEEVGRIKIKALLNTLQGHIKSGDIKKDHPYAKEITLIQEQLVKAHNQLKGDKPVKIVIDKVDDYRAILEKELSGLGLLPSIIAAVASKTVEHFTRKAMNKPTGISGVKPAKKKRTSFSNTPWLKKFGPAAGDLKGIDDEILDKLIHLYENASIHSTGTERVVIGKVDTEAAQLIKDKLSIDVSGYTRIVRFNEARHIFKMHGEGKETDKKQKEITPSDFALYPYVVSKFDNVDREKRGGTEFLKYTKSIGNYFIVIEEVFADKKELRLKSMFIKKGRPQQKVSGLSGSLHVGSTPPANQRPKRSAFRRLKISKKPATPESKNVNVAGPGGFVRADQKEIIKAPGTFRLPGEIGKFLGDIQPFKYMIVVKGDPHAGKSEFLSQLQNAFAEAGKDVGAFDLEQGGLTSRDTRGALERNVTPENLKRISITGEAAEGLKTIKKAAKHFQVIFIDSYQKLDIPSKYLDSLRHEHPETIFVVIFQQTSDGKTRGGSAADFDTPVLIKVHRVDETFSNNYAELIKNRGNALDMKYMIKAKKTLPLTENTNNDVKNK